MTISLRRGVSNEACGVGDGSELAMRQSCLPSSILDALVSDIEHRSLSEYHPTAFLGLSHGSRSTSSGHHSVFLEYDLDDPRSSPTDSQTGPKLHEYWEVIADKI